MNGLEAAVVRIRDVADQATPGPWQYGKSWIGAVAVMGPIGQPIASCGDGDGSEGEAAHIAVWSPDKARAVAALLEAVNKHASREHVRGAVTTVDDGTLLVDCFCGGMYSVRQGADEWCSLEMAHKEHADRYSTPGYLEACALANLIGDVL